MTRSTIRVLRWVLVILVGLGLVVQVGVLPAIAAGMADTAPELAYLQYPYLVAFVFVVACGQAVVVATWKLLDMVAGDEIFHERAFVWVTLMVTALLTAAALVGGFVVFQFVVISVGSPGLFVLASGVAMMFAGMGLLTVVMRALLRQAVDNEAELAEVI